MEIIEVDEYISTNNFNNLVNKLEKHINDNNMVFIALSWCPYCKKARDLIKNLKAKYIEYVITNADNKEDFKQLIKTKLNVEQNTFPYIYLGEYLIGGASDLESYIVTSNKDKKSHPLKICYESPNHKMICEKVFSSHMNF